MPALLRVAAAAVLLLLCLPASGQPVFDSNDSGTLGALSGSNECGLDPGPICSRHKSRVSAEANRADEMLSTLNIGFSDGAPCSLSAPRPLEGLAVDSRNWNECPSGRANRTESLSTTSLPGPDYGLNSLRICTATDGTLQGIEARFFKLPHLSRRAPGQEVATRRFERNRCSTWKAWSVCSQGRSAAGIDIYSQTENNGDIQGLQLVCKRVLTNPR